MNPDIKGYDGSVVADQSSLRKRTPPKDSTDTDAMQHRDVWCDEFGNTGAAVGHLIVSDDKFWLEVWTPQPASSARQIKRG
jgi:hypothetical protein